MQYWFQSYHFRLKTGFVETLTIQQKQNYIGGFTALTFMGRLGFNEKESLHRKLNNAQESKVLHPIYTCSVFVYFIKCCVV